MDGAIADVQLAALGDQMQHLTAELEHESLTEGLSPLRPDNRACHRPLCPEVADEATHPSTRRM